MPQARPQQKNRISVAAITGSHGVRGNVKIKPFTETPESLGRFDKVYLENGQQVALKILSLGSKDVVLARLDKVESRDASDALRGQHLYVDRSALPDLADDEIYHADLLGLDAVLADGSPLGRIDAIHDFGAGNVVEIMPPQDAPQDAPQGAAQGAPQGAAQGAPQGAPQGASIMLPFAGAALVAVELDKGRVVLAPPDGLLAGAEDEAEDEAEDGEIEKENN